MPIMADSMLCQSAFKTNQKSQLHPLQDRNQEPNEINKIKQKSHYTL